MPKSNITCEMEKAAEALIEAMYEMSRNDKKEAIINLLFTFLELEATEVELDKKFLDRVEDSAIKTIIRQPNRLHLRLHELGFEEKRNIAIIEATIGELKRLGILKKNPRFNFYDSNDFEKL